MHFDWQRFFVGTRFALFCYSAAPSGGSVDIDGFRDGLSLGEVKNFRQFGSRTAGHPERDGVCTANTLMGDGSCAALFDKIAAKTPTQKGDHQ